MTEPSNLPLIDTVATQISFTTDKSIQTISNEPTILLQSHHDICVNCPETVNSPLSTIPFHQSFKTTETQATVLKDVEFKPVTDSYVQTNPLAYYDLIIKSDTTARRNQRRRRSRKNRRGEIQQKVQRSQIQHMKIQSMENEIDFSSSISASLSLSSSSTDVEHYYHDNHIDDNIMKVSQWGIKQNRQRVKQFHKLLNTSSKSVVCDKQMSIGEMNSSREKSISYLSNEQKQEEIGKTAAPSTFSNHATEPDDIKLESIIRMMNTTFEGQHLSNHVQGQTYSYTKLRNSNYVCRNLDIDSTSHLIHGSQRQQELYQRGSRIEEELPYFGHEKCVCFNNGKIDAAEEDQLLSDLFFICN
ncbi:unnamed protein product [Heterobilharzia americana]|nr:unnamed protein product [Heterobilharzia americana]